WRGQEVEAEEKDHEECEVADDVRREGHVAYGSIEPAVGDKRQRVLADGGFNDGKNSARDEARRHGGAAVLMQA
mgnify:CR=1